MPELPEVETIKNLLKPQIINRKIISIDILRDKTILGDPTTFKTSLENETFLDVTRIGKYLIFHLTNDKVFISHLRMEGKYFEYDINEDNTVHARVVFNLDNDKKIIYDDSRCFGIMKLSSENNYRNEKEIAKLGPEPFDIENVNYFIERTKKLEAPIKSTLLDQTLMTGLGNIYVDETLYASKIYPLKPACAITKEEWQAILDNSKAVLTKAIMAGGSTIRSYHPGKGMDGNFQGELLCYGKANTRCSRCSSLMHFTKVGGRGTTYCPTCQHLVKDKIIVGITGRIASGKSTVISIFKEHNYPTISADDIVTDLYQNSEVLKENLEQKLNISFNSKHVDKDILRAHLSKHPKDIIKVNKIVHPLVKQEIEKKVNNNNHGLIFIEVPLLYESKMEKIFDFIIGVDINIEKQAERIKKRNASSYQDLLLINSNNSFDEYYPLLDFVIVNNGTLNDLNKKVMDLLNELKTHLPQCYQYSKPID